MDKLHPNQYDDMNYNLIIKSTEDEPNLTFYDSKLDLVKNNIWQDLSNGLWRTFSVDAYIYNNLLCANQLEKSKALFKDVHQIVAGVRFDKTSRTFRQEYYKPKRVEHSLTHLLDSVAQYVDSLKCKRIGVHLSGGLDSSLIMCLLRELHIPFVPIGLKSDTFEFRTERRIQEIMLEYGEDGLLIDYEEYPHYSGLCSIPAHQIPDADIKSNAGATALAKAFKDRGCDVVFSGLGGDTLFVDKISNIENLRFNIENEFLNPTEAYRIYNPQGIRLLSFFANTDIIDCICSLREGRKEDPKKLWTRQLFKSILPKELAFWSYSADFFALSMYGLEKSKPTIKKLIEETNDRFQQNILNNDFVNNILHQDVLSFEYIDYIKYCSVISIASWCHSLFNNG